MVEQQSASVRVATLLAACDGGPRRELRSLAPEAIARRVSASAVKESLKQLERWSRDGLLVLAVDDAAFPPLLREIPDPPLLLFLRGDVSCLTRPAVAVVGSRRASSAGLRIAHDMAGALAEAGVTVVSGLASGIDAAAHAGALAANGRTIAVLGSGLHQVYPASNRPLAERIVTGDGLLISEYAPEVRPRRHHFPERNRIISGLCEAVVVVEASEQSGSLITARLALEQGRDVLAVPGSIHNPNSAGCHRLIRDGAALIDGVSTLMQELGLDGPVQDSPPAAWAPVWHALTPEPMDAERVSQVLSLALPEVLLALAELEVRGFVATGADGYSRRCPQPSSGPRR